MAHLGGMTRAWLRHRPIHFAFHCRGISRATVFRLFEISTLKPGDAPKPLARER
jgi:hypothetical protein